MNKQVEYEALREELLHSMQTVKNYRILLYTIVPTFLAYAFDKDDALLFLIPFCVIIPFYLLAMRQVDSSMRIGTYTYVFIEPGTECQWETRLYKYDQENKNQYDTKISSIDPYWILSSCCVVLSVLKLDYANINLKFCITVVIQVILSMICIYIFRKKELII